MLRPLAPNDFGMIATASKSDVPDWTFVPRDLSEVDAKVWVERRAAASAAGGPIRLVIEVNGEAAGVVGAHQPYANDPGLLETFYFVLPEFRRRGLASAALSLMGEHAKRVTPELRRLQLFVIEGNPASARVAERAGYRREGLIAKQVMAVNGFGPRDAALYGLIVG
ncbi:MAG: GNAT family N-acetyltransferase [Polyangiaceae bacterium]|nr:GNAT family N-acetyltransferase [Polyangiaceae bacterium]